VGSLLLGEPVLDAQFGDAREVAHVAGHKGRTAGEGACRYAKVGLRQTTPADLEAGAQRSVGLAVYVFTRSGDSWVQTAKLTASDGADSERLGRSVAIDGDTIVAGAPVNIYEDQASLGSVYTFARTGAPARTETAKLTAEDVAAEDRLGWSVAVDGDTIVAGAPFDTVGDNVFQGSASIFFSRRHHRCARRVLARPRRSCQRPARRS